MMIRNRFFLLTVSLLLCSIQITTASSRLGTETVQINGTKTLTLPLTYSSVLEYHATSVRYSWSSSNTSVANVTYNGYKYATVKGNNAGTCKIYFKADFFIDNKHDVYDFYWDITVDGYVGGGTTVVEATSATVTPSTLTLEVGQTYQLGYIVYPLNATYSNEWTCYKSDVATVSSNGLVTAVGPGTAYVLLWVIDSQGNYPSSESLLPSCEVTVVERSKVTLDENSTEAPIGQRGVNVTVQRTLNAGKWSTICLPFAMTREQVKSAFGDNIELAHFTGYDTVRNSDGDVSGITINFTDASAIEANHPYLIMPRSNITEFSADCVDIIPVENPAVSYANSSFVGTYTASTLVPHNSLFISDNNFWYSTGNTSMKAYRAYFTLEDVLSGHYSSRISFTVDNEATGINDVHHSSTSPHIIYDLQGRQVKCPNKGMYIMNGKKILK